MYKFLSVCCFLAMGLVNLMGESFVFNSNFANKSSWTTPQAKFLEQNKFMLVNDETSQGQVMAIVRRGAMRPAVKLTKELGQEEDFSYSFDVIRLSEDGSFCVGLENAKHEGVGGIFVNNAGELAVYDANKRYTKTTMVLEQGKLYNISVKCSRNASTTEVAVKGLGKYVTKVIFPANLDTLQFSAQPPVGNKCLINNVQLHVFDSVADPMAGLKVFAPDLKDKSSWSSPAGKFLEQDKFRLLNDETTGNRPMLINRRGAVRPCIELSQVIGENEDFSYSFDIIRQSDDASTCASVTNAENENSGLIYINNGGDLLIYSAYKKYETSGMNLVPGKLYKITVRASRELESVEVEVSGLGKYSVKNSYPKNLKKLQFASQAPVGNTSLLDNIEIHVYPARIKTRANELKGVEAKLVSTGKIYKEFTDGNTLNVTDNIPANSVLEFILPKRINATGIQIFGGNINFRNNPSGACAPLKYRVEGLHNGAWMILVDAKDVPNTAHVPVFSTNEIFSRHDFPTVVIDQLRIVFEGSHDTGMRMSGPVSKENHALYLREIELFSDKKIAAGLDIRDLVTCDWRLPVYRNADTAKLYAIVAKHPLAPEKAEVIIRNADNSVYSTTPVKLKTGENICDINIAGLAQGRYMTEFKIGEQAIKFLLRVERVDSTVTPVEPLMVNGKKMFFTPDNYTLSKVKNLTVELTDVKPHKLAQTPSPDKLLLFGNDLYQAKDGRYILKVTDRNYKGQMFGKDSYRILAADDIDQPFMPIDKAPARGYIPQVFQFPEAGTHPKAPNGTKFELYDKEKHGEMPLKNLNYVYNYFPTDYGCFKTTRRSIYVTGKTVDGTWVMMRSEPLFIDKTLYGDNDFDTGYYSNDNFGGMWLSEDGKECYWAQGQTMKRYKPFVADYDNFSTGIRMLTIYSTTDGVNWKYRSCVTVPDEDDSFCSQHYGMARFVIKNGDVSIIYFYTYDAVAQQIYVDLLYSRDGVNYHKFPGKKPFIRSTNPRDWYFGHIFMGSQIVHKNGKYYQLACYTATFPHFLPEVLTIRDKASDVTTADVRKRFEQRGLAEKWPYFQKAGGYEGLAELAREGYFAAGVLEFREDGWFSLTAKDEEGTFVSRKLSGGKSVYANVEVASNGLFEVELLDAENEAILAKATVTGDKLNEKLFDLPQAGEYILRGKMKNAKLYTLKFQ